MESLVEAYLDIETTGLSPRYSQITVVGIHICNSDATKFIQIIGREITANTILDALKGVSVIYTYNGRGFDIPFIYYCLGINLAELFKHHDLMLDCWRNNLYGGFKAVERQLGIDRSLKGISGYDAVRLWWRYVNDYDQDALNILLEYNKEDVVNLKTLKERLL
ncbi:ribonuclease H-like domain-containing protein [Chloroflexota bacterium]